MTLFWVIVAGATVGLIFDFYRSLRSWLGWRKGLTFIGDLLFSLIALVILFNFFEKANALAFRFYIIWGSLLGLVIYLRLISNFIVRFFFGCYKFVSYFVDLICRVIGIPMRGIILSMQPFYTVLRWLGLLLYRISGYILFEPTRHIKRRWKSLCSFLFPPRKEV